MIALLAGCRKHASKAQPDANPPIPIEPAPPATVGAHPRMLLTPAVLAELKTRAKPWAALQSTCDAYAKGTVEWPDGNDYPTPGNIGEGYQGEGYFHALMNVALCHRLAPTKGYDKVGVDVLVKMSEPKGPHAPVPEHDDVYGIRFYAVGLALGYDWLFASLSNEQRTRVYEAANRWIEAYETRGFGRDHPQGNYFAGFYAAKALTALATKPENPKADKHWSDFRDRVHGTMVQPYYARFLEGGGWPEGWSYGQLATINMIVPSVAAIDAASVDLVRDAKHPYAFAGAQAEHAIHFSWPSRASFDDRGAMRPGANPSSIHGSFVTSFAGLLDRLGDPRAAVFHRFAREVRAASPNDKPELWQELLFWDEGAKEIDLATLPRSYLARGMGTVAMRSSWDKSAVWASFTAGPHVANADSGEMSFDQGSFAIVRGNEPFVVNATTAIQRDPRGSDFADKFESQMYDEIFGNHDANPAFANRTVYNVFYVHASHYGQIPNPEAATNVAMFEDGGAYVAMRGERLEEAYRTPKKGTRPVKSWTRRMVYLRPGLFVVDDRTESAAAGADQWLAFHVEKPLVDKSGGRFETGGAIVSLLPKGAAFKTVDLFDAHKVYRLEVRPPDKNVAQQWLTVFDATTDEAVEASLTAPSIGVALRGKSASFVVLSARGATLEYEAPKGALHVITDLKPNEKANVVATNDKVTVSFGAGSRNASPQGVLAFRLDAP